MGTEHGTPEDMTSGQTASGQPASGQTAWDSGDAGCARSPACVLSANVLSDLLEKPKTFSFIQAVRLLLLANASRWRGSEDFLRRGLRIHPELSLAHPGTDITDIKKLPPLADGEVSDGEASDGESPEASRERFDLTVTFLALYGASSPLPTFYTEELVEEAREDRDDSRRFLDIFNQSLYALYYRAFNAYKLGQRTLEEGDGRLLEAQQCLLGMGLKSLRDAAGLTRPDLGWISLATRHTRTADGLARTLQILLGVKHVLVEQCVPRRVGVALGQRSRLGGARLGGSVVGTSVADVEGAFRIHLFGLDEEELSRFLPESGAFANIRAVVRRYLNTPLSFDVMLHTRANAAKPGSLGSCRLGSSSFLAEREASVGRRYRFSVPRTTLAVGDVQHGRIRQ